MPIEFGFEYDGAPYTITEGTNLEVCIDFISGSELTNDICLEVYIDTLCKFIYNALIAYMSVQYIGQCVMSLAPILI